MMAAQPSEEPVMSGTDYALSLKQPWATLLLNGRKTVDVRKWPTARRGRILIHAARLPDERPEAWALVPPELLADAERVGGVLGAAVITGCLTYDSREGFAADRERHLIDPDWWEPPALYGFVFAHPEELPFRPIPGSMRFFPVNGAHS